MIAQLASSAAMPLSNYRVVTTIIRDWVPLALPPVLASEGYSRWSLAKPVATSLMRITMSLFRNLISPPRPTSGRGGRGVRGGGFRIGSSHSSLVRGFLSIYLISFFSVLCADEPLRFRTDADGPVNANKKPAKDKDTGPEWYQLVDGHFPPVGSAHSISGELIWVDHLERRFHLRVDRNDSQDRGEWDLALDSLMLPYGEIYYHGSPAALQDIPLGTHLHGLYYLRHPDDKTPHPDTQNNRRSPERDFRRCFSIVDDFTFRARQNQLWHIDSVDIASRKLIATLQHEGTSVGKPQTFDLLASTRVLQGKGFGDLGSLEPGQTVLFNLTWVTLYGPGRITELWIDEESRLLATNQQLDRHRDHVRERGLPGWINEVNDKAQTVTITFFAGVDAGLFQEISMIDGQPVGWPLSKEADNPAAPKGTIAVARECLMTYDPVNDRKGGNIFDIRNVPIEPGSSGVQIRVQCDMMLEGFRPHRIVRFYPATWKVLALPREEQFFGRE